MTQKKTKQINPQSFKKLWKTKKATENIEPILLDIVKEYRVKVHKPQGSVTRKDLADRIFSEYIRLKYADKNGNCKCVTCGAVVPRTEIQNGHFVSRGNMKYRFSEENCFPQDYRCNCLLNGNYQAYTLFMIDKFGRKKVEEMINDKTTKEYKQYEYEEMIIKWYGEITEMKRKIKR